jgi:hypothetical protein
MESEVVFLSSPNAGYRVGRCGANRLSLMVPNVDYEWEGGCGVNGLYLTVPNVSYEWEGWFGGVGIVGVAGTVVLHWLEGFKC